MSFMAENPKRALLVIDIQNEYFTGKLPITYPAGSLANVLSAMDAAREHGLPVVVIQHASPQPDASVFRKGSKEWELHPEVAARPHDVLIHKSLPGSFTGTELETWLRERGVGYGCHCRLHDPDVLRHDGTPGNAPRFRSGISFRRNRHTGNQERRGRGVGRRVASGDPGHPADAVQPRHEDGGLDERALNAGCSPQQRCSSQRVNN